MPLVTIFHRKKLLTKMFRVLNGSDPTADKKTKYRLSDENFHCTITRKSRMKPLCALIYSLKINTHPMKTDDADKS